MRTGHLSSHIFCADWVAPGTDFSLHLLNSKLWLLPSKVQAHHWLHDPCLAAFFTSGVHSCCRAASPTAAGLGCLFLFMSLLPHAVLREKKHRKRRDNGSVSGLQHVLGH